MKTFFNNHILYKIKAVFSPLKRERLSPQDLLTANFRHKKFAPSLVIISIAFILFLSTKICDAAISASAVFEFRSTATASMVNGGGFVTGASGTDYSLQDAAQWTASDGTSNASTTFTSATMTFTSAIVGNVLHLTAGTNGTVGWYEITGYMDANTITLDRNCSTGAMTNGTFYVGGALSLNSTLDDDFFEEISGANTADGVKVWFKNGTYTLGEGVSIAGAGGDQKPIVVEGYNVTRGDAPTGTNRPTIAQGANNWTYSGANWDEYNIIRTGTGTTVLGGNGVTKKLINCKVTNNSSTAARNSISDFGWVVNCELGSYRGNAINTSSSSSFVKIYGCYIWGSNNGVTIGGTGGSMNRSIMNSIIESCVTNAIVFTGAQTGDFLISGNTLYGSENTTGTGGNFITGTTQVKILNNIIYGFATGVSHADVQTVGYDDYNDYNNNYSDVSNWTKGANDSVLAPSFTNVGQVTGTTGVFVAGGSKLVDTSKDFTALLVAAGDIVYIVSGTGVTAGNYLIDSISTTTNPNDTLNITIPASPGTNTTADKVYQITTGHNFAIGTNLKALGFPGAFQGGLTTGYMDIGAVQRVEPAGGAANDVFWIIQ